MNSLDEREIVARFLKAQDSLVMQSSDLSLGSLSEMVSKKAIDLQPHYQRRERWNAYMKMDDVEHVFRFFTTRAYWNDMGGSLSSRMDNYMAIKRKATELQLITIY